MAENKPVYMLNALWFKPDGGREKYIEYMQAAAPLTAKYGSKLVPTALIPGTPIYGDFDADLVFFVEWSSMAVFQQFAQDPEYQKIAHLRTEAISKSILVPCQAMF
ncbi:MAG: DUF1330 domain-containing protein [Anaerolineae bacterium]|nr:DUF1330 domain-containing protein [Anaerolineae bacterium]